MMGEIISVQDLEVERERGFGPQLLDVRRSRAFAEARGIIPGSVHLDPEQIEAWWRGLDLGRPIVAYCVHGHEVSQGVVAVLRSHGYPARYLEGGIEAWSEAGHRLAAKRGSPTVWVTRERPKIDRIACPWLIRRFIDPSAHFLYVPAPQVISVAEDVGGTPFDVPGVAFSHVGEGCSFDTFIDKHNLDDPALLKLAEVVRGADTDRLDLAPQAAGLFAISVGLSANIPSDEHMLRHGMVVYDALYRWFRDRSGETHHWPPVMTQ